MINKTTLTLQTRVLYELSVSDPQQLVVNILCFLGSMGGMNVDVCIDGEKNDQPGNLKANRNVPVMHHHHQALS